jgi:hypothetical protein
MSLGPPLRAKHYEPTLVASTRSLGTKEKMSNPFFTTKPAGEGTGLGLFASSGLLCGPGQKYRAVQIHWRHQRQAAQAGVDKHGPQSTGTNSDGNVFLPFGIET